MQKRKWIPAAVLALAVLICESVFGAGLTEAGDKVQFIKSDGTQAAEEFCQSGGKYYYFDAEGAMVKDVLVEDDGEIYYQDSDGARLSRAWKKLEDPQDGETYWYYFQMNGRAKKNGWLTLEGKKYHFTDWHMDTGWYEEPSAADAGVTNTYYLGEADDGSAETGWLPYKGTDENSDKEVGWYYFDPASCKMVSAGEKKIGKTWYAFSDKGIMVDGFAVVENTSPEGLWDQYQTKYYDPVTGARAEGWRYVDDSDETAEDGTSLEGWYYFKKGLPYTAWSNTTLISSSVGVAKIGNYYYAFDTQGRMVKGLVLSTNDEEKYNNRYYYFGPEGQMQVGRVRVTDSQLDGPAEEMYFETRYSTIPAHGMSLTGEAQGKLYDNGAPVKAEQDRYALVTLSDGKTYVVSENGTLKKSGTVVLDNEDKMKISYDGENYSWEKIN